MSAETPEIDHGQAFLFAVQQELESDHAQFPEVKLYVAYLLTDDEKLEETWQSLPEYTKRFFSNVGLHPESASISEDGIVRVAHDFEFNADEVIAVAPIIDDGLKRTGLLARLFLTDQDEPRSEKINDLISDVIDKIEAEEEAEAIGDLLVKHMKKLTDKKMPGAQIIEKLARSLGRRFEIVRDMIDQEDDPNRYVLADGTTGRTTIKHNPPPSRAADGTHIENVDTGGFL